MSYRRAVGPWLALGTAGSQAAAERWVARLMKRNPGQWSAGEVLFTYRPGVGLSVGGKSSP